MIVIPMAGMSSRFFNAGYKLPKYMLEAHGKTLFEHSLSSFKEYFESQKFLFIVRDYFDTPNFVFSKAKELGIKEYYIEVLKSETRGQAETVSLGVSSVIKKNHEIQTESLIIFNIDTFRYNFVFPESLVDCDGYLEVFKGDGANWSFAKPAEDTSTRVTKTAEKQKISNLCSTGLYYFKDTQLFLDTFNYYLKRPSSEWEKGELYIAPLYNILIERGFAIHYHLINNSEVIFCGTPLEYNAFQES